MSIPTIPRANFSINRLQCSRTKDHYVRLICDQVNGLAPVTLIERMSDASNPRLLRDRLLNAGAQLPLRDETGTIVKDPLSLLPNTTGLLAQSIGWHGDSDTQYFLLPDGIIGDAGNIEFEVGKSTDCLSARKSGTLAEWRTKVAGRALPSQAIATLLLASLAGPLLHLSRVSEGMILNIAGVSSSGKSTAVAVAASVWGDPADASTWNATERGITEAAAANSDTCFILDDVEQADPIPRKRLPKINELTHQLTSGRSKIYAKRASADDLDPLVFRCIALSSSPQTLESFMRNSGFERTDGDRVRLLEITVPPGEVGGIWKTATGKVAGSNTAERSDEIKQMAQTFHGTAGRSLVTYLVADLTGSRSAISKYMKQFRKKVGAQERGVERRIADKVGLWYAAGRLAIKAGVLPWTKNDVLNVTRYALLEILRSAFSTQIDPLSIGSSCADFLSGEDAVPKGKVPASGFELADSSPGYNCLATGQLYLRRERLEEKLGSKNDRKLSTSEWRMVLKGLHDSGALLTGEGATPTKTVRFKSSKVRMLVFNTEKLLEFQQATTKSSTNT